MKATKNATVVESSNEVMDSRIVKLNELKSVKMANLSKGKRPAAKEAKELATYILNNWDKLAELKNIKSEDVKNEDLQNILASRFKNFEDASKAAEKAVKEVEKADSKKAEPKAKEEKQPKEKPAKTARKVGDVHPNGKWAWTEYATGKFDWRTIPSLKEKTGAKPKTDNPEVKKGSEKPVQAKKNVAKQPKAKEAKKNEPEVKKEFTTSDFIAMPKMRRGDKPSKAQEEALKLILKGYWIWNNGGVYFFKNEAGKTKSCNMESVIAMFKKYGVVELPVDLVR